MDITLYKTVDVSLTIAEKTSDMLVALYREMIDVHNNNLTFHQDDCTTCVIGNGLRRGLFDVDMSECTYDNMDVFLKAIGEMGLTDSDRLYKYLFSDNSDIYIASKQLGLPAGINCTSHSDLTALDACVRIAHVLNETGYANKVKTLPDIPK